MLEKIVRIKNVGVFQDYSAPGNVKLTNATLIFAGNGQGKTTISAILRTLSEENSDLRARKRVGADGDCSVFIRSDSEGFRYSPHQWDKQFPKIDVFDEEFIHSNVHSGYFVDRRHKRGLYRVVVGSKGKRLAQKVEEIDEEIRNINKQLRDQSQELEQVIEGDRSVDDFISLPELEDVNEKLESTQKELELAERAQEIRKKSVLAKINIPALPDNPASLLEMTLEEVGQSAVDRVQDHIEDRLGPNGEPWVQEGLGYVQDKQCPFCDQGLEGVELVDAYRRYFSEQYKELQSEVASTVSQIEDNLSDERLQTLREELENCVEHYEYWGEITDIDVNIPEANSVIPTLRKLRHALIDRLERKQNAPLERIELGTRAKEALNTSLDMVERLGQLNDSIESANIAIEQKKRDLAGADPDELRSKIDRLEDSKVRHSETVTELVDDYKTTLKAKQEKKDEKEETKEKLDEHAEQIFPKYQDRINRHLERFGAGFRICEIEPNYVGRQPNSDYALRINEETVSLGSGDTTEQPAFRNTLSAGDKSALALAFFLARLDLEDDLEERVVVFDDPIASFDSWRQTYTRNQIARLILQARQGIVMSHDPHFLVRLHRKLVNERQTGTGPISTLEITATSSGSELAQWDIEKDAKTAFFRKYALMRDFLEDPSSVNKTEAIQAIRPTLEHNLRSRFPGTFSQGQNLGRYLEQIRESDETDEIGVLKEHYELLDDLNEYTAPYHHASTPDQAPPRINSTELTTNIKMALKFMRGSN